MKSLIRILEQAKDLWPYYLGILLCSLAITATGLLTPFIIKGATDYIVDVTQGKESGVAPVIWFAAALLVADLANSLLTNIGGYLGDTMSVRLRAALSQRYFAKLLRLPQRYFDNELTGTIINRLSRSITETTSFLNAFANNFFPMLLTTAAVLVITAFYSWPLALLLAVIYPLFMWLTTMTSAKWQVLEKQKNREFDVAGGRFAEAIAQIRVVKSFGQERRELEQFAAHYDATIGLTEQQSRYWHRMDVSRRAALNIIFFGIFAIIFAQTVQGTFSLGDMVLLIQLVNLARAPIFSMSYLVDFSQRAVAGSRDYFEVMAEADEIDGPGTRGAATDSISGPSRESSQGAAGLTSSGSSSGIVFENVDFSYTDGEQVLRDVSFTIPAGSRVALVGESGGGKTTMASLLLGLYRPQSGRIVLEGQDLSQMSLSQLRSDVGIVFQDASLFSGTIRENVAYGTPDARDEEVVAAATSANAHEFVSRFAKGYESEIGERGLKLSGGQKQRIAVARAILKNAPVLILDEATSSLDGRSERLVQEGLERLMADRTTLIIAHRLSTISSVDQIITLRDGRVDEIGTPEELAGTGGIYSELLRLQASASKKDRKRLQEFDIRV